MTSLKDRLYSIDEMSFSNAQLMVSLKLNYEFPGIADHFPGNIVMPAVLQLQIIQELVESYLEKTMIPQSITKSKFLHALRPENKEPILIKIKFKTQGSVLNLEAIMSTGNQRVCLVHASYTVI